jgi:uncharacterized protein
MCADFERSLAMPEPIRSFDRLNIPAPCDADWDSMIGDDRMRFCEHCELHVTDLSAMTRRSAMEFVARSRGRVCVRFIQKPNGSVLTRTMPERLYRIHRRVSRVAAGAFTATLSLATATAQTGSSAVDRLRSPVELIQTDEQPEIIPDEFTATVSGTIKTLAADTNSKDDVDSETYVGISEATVVLVNRETGEEREVMTSALGQYSFQLLPQGEYVLWARKKGFRTETETVTVPPNTAVNVDVEMYERTMGYGFGGAMGMVTEPEDPLFKAISDNEVEKVRALVSADLDLDRPNRHRGMSLLTEAVERGNPRIVEMLLAFGADANLRNSSGRSPLMSLTEATSAEVVRNLIAAGARPNARTDNGATPLMLAAGKSPLAVIKELIDAGANVNARDSSGETCLFYAARGNKPEVISLLLASGVDANVRNDDGDDALMAMAPVGVLDSFRLLLDRGTATNVVNEDGRTLLMQAVLNQNPKLAKILIETGADINAKDKFGNTPLILAASSANVDAVRLLIVSRADLEERDNDQETALMRAVAANDSECVEVLLTAGADVTNKNSEGKTALDLAREYERKEVVALLKSHGTRH